MDKRLFSIDFCLFCFMNNKDCLTFFCLKFQIEIFCILNHIFELNNQINVSLDKFHSIFSMNLWFLKDFFEGILIYWELQKNFFILNFITVYELLHISVKYSS